MKIFYAAGPGNLIGTYKFHRVGEHDPSQLAITYSSQFFDVCRKLNLKAKVVTLYPEKNSLIDENCVIENWLLPKLRLRQDDGYRLDAFWYALRLNMSILAYGADVALVAEIPYWFLLSPLSLFGIKIIPTIHCTLWKTHRKQRPLERLLWIPNGWFFRHCVAGVMCVSDEISRQVRSLLLREAVTRIMLHTHLFAGEVSRGSCERIADCPHTSINTVRWPHRG